MKEIFVKGAIKSKYIMDIISKYNTELKIGAHSIFLGQVRNDEIKGKEVRAIDYYCYKDMAIKVMQTLTSEIKAKHKLISVHVNHSLGEVEKGEICLFVYTSSRHRKNAVKACSELVERIKIELPVWGKELLDDERYEWKC